MSEGKKRSRKSMLVHRILSKLNNKAEKLSKVKKRKPSEDVISEDSGVKQENQKRIKKNATPYHEEAAMPACDDNDWEDPEEFEPQYEFGIKIPEIIFQQRSVCARIEPMPDQMENKDGAMPFPVREDNDTAVNETDAIDLFVSSEIDISGDTAHKNAITEKQDNPSADIIDLNESDSNGKVSPVQIYSEEIYLEENCLEYIPPEEIYLDEIFLEETTLEEISAEEITPKEISAEEISPKEISLKEISPEKISSEEISSEEISPEEISSEERSPEEISSEERSPEEINAEKISPEERSPEEMDPEKNYLVKTTSAETSLKEIAPKKIFPGLSLSDSDIVNFFKDNTDLQMFRLMLKIKSEKVPYTKIVSYKCYECQFAWQHYAEFREHMKIHSGKLNIGLEYVAPIKKHIIAYRDEISNLSWWSQLLPVLENRLEIFKCLPCNTVFKSKKELSQHTLSKFLCACGNIGSCDVMYAHKGTCSEYLIHCYPKKCRDVVLNRFKLQTHKESCKRCRPYPCLVCQFNGPTAETLFIHQRDEHTVRSDEITTVSLRKCSKCGQIHPEPSQAHYCPEKVGTHSCKFCGDRFQSALLLGVHLNAGGYRPKCSVDNCGAILEAGCLQPIHDREWHDALKLAVNGSRAGGQNHFRSTHTGHGRRRNHPQPTEIVPKDGVVVEEGDIHLMVTQETVLHVNNRKKESLKTKTINCNVDDVTSEQTNIGNEPKVSYLTSGSRGTVVTETDTLDASQEIQVSESDSIEETSSTDSETEFQDNTDIVVEEYVANKTLNVKKETNINSKTDINENAVYEEPTADIKTGIQDNIDTAYKEYTVNETVNVKEEQLDITEHDLNIPEDYCASYNKIQESLKETEEFNVSTKLTIKEAIKTPEFTEAKVKQIKSKKWLNQFNKQSIDVKKMSEAEIKIPKVNEIIKAPAKSLHAKKNIKSVINTVSKERNIKKIRVSEQLARQKQQQPTSDEEELVLFQEFVNEDEDISSVPSTSQEPISVEEFIKHNSVISMDLEPHDFETSWTQFKQ